MTFPRSLVLLIAAAAAAATSCSKSESPKPGAQGQPAQVQPGIPAPGGLPGAGAARTPAQVATGLPPSGSTPAGTGMPNFVLITMDSTRPDHIGCYENPRAVTPALDQLASEGVKCTSAIAVAPMTLPSTASILTGLYPPRHGVRDDATTRLGGTVLTLAEHLKRQGYGTAAAIGSHMLGSTMWFDRGFESYAESQRASRTAAFVIDDALAAVERLKSRPFFLWVELDDPHAPYTPPPGMLKKFPKQPYDGEIAWMDAQIKRLVDLLRTQGLIDRTLIVATADHGESLGEHDELTHGLFLYDSTLKVPLIVRYPARIPAGTKYEGLVSSVDIAPTALELMGILPMGTSQGESCAARLAGMDAPEREIVYSESLLGQRAYGWVPLHALRSPIEKFIDAPTPERFNVRRDPSETLDLYAQNSKEAEDVWRASIDEALRTIGVDDAEAKAARNAKGEHRDLKALAASHNLYQQAVATIEEGHPKETMPLLQQALKKNAENRAASTLLAALRAASGDAQAGAAGAAAGAEGHFAKGSDLASKGDNAAAEKELRAAVAADPNMADAWNKLGILLDKTNRRPEAITAFSKALEAAPDHSDALFNRAKLELLTQRLPDSRRDLDRLLKVNADYPAAHFLEAHVCVAEHNNEGARAALTKFLARSDIDPKMKAAARDMLQKLGS